MVKPKKKIASLFRNLALKIYNFFGQPNYLRRLQRSTLISMLDITEGLIILDLGSGDMQYSICLSRQSSVRVLALDNRLSSARIKRASDHEIELICADGQLLPFPSHSIDRILMSSLLHMVPAPDKLLAECHRVLKPGGCMVLSVPNNYLYIPKLFASAVGMKLCKFAGIPRPNDELEKHLNTKFGVQGPSGYYSSQDLYGLLHKERFQIVQHNYVPGMIGSFFWECSILAFMWIGNIAFHFLLILYPLARTCDLIGLQTQRGSEHLVKILPIQQLEQCRN